MTACAAIQYSDQMNCSVCHLVWDTNDPEPPTCPLVAQARVARERMEGVAKASLNALQLCRAGLQLLEPAQATQYSAVLRELDRLIEIL